MNKYWIVKQPNGETQKEKRVELESLWMAKGYSAGSSVFMKGCRISFAKDNLTVKNEGDFPILVSDIEEDNARITVSPGEKEKLNWGTIRVTLNNAGHSNTKRKRKGTPSAEPKKKKSKLIFTESSLGEEKDETNKEHEEEVEKKDDKNNEVEKEEEKPLLSSESNSFVVYREPSGSVSQMNFLFYTNKETSKPDCLYISDFHEKWFGDYENLEMSHGFIQWLFPIFEASAFNWTSAPLTRTEARLIRRNEVAAKNVVASYKLMLNFYGLRLVDEQTGEVDYVEDESLKRSRMKNLNRMSHNYLRITRILKSLGHLGFTRYKKPFLEALHKAVFTDNLAPNARDSYKRFWSMTVKYDSPDYFEFTREIPEDREPSVFFSITH